eukprot:7434971-Alexandrium_andersonii.AAC.1
MPRPSQDLDLAWQGAQDAIRHALNARQCCTPPQILNPTCRTCRIASGVRSLKRAAPKRPQS